MSTTFDTPAPPKRRRKRDERPDPRQLGLFDALMDSEPKAPSPSVSEDPVKLAEKASLAPSSKAPQLRGHSTGKPPRSKSPASAPRPRRLTVADMPDYPLDILAAVDAIIAALPPERALYTYRDIQKSFGISRATVARRVKEGLVPGVCIANGRVLEDGSVRRFDREQVRWLLLAMRGKMVG